MREIKFRAWDKVNHRMLYHFLIGSQGEVFIIKNPMLPSGDDFGMADIIPSIDTVELMQYTGLKDNTKWEDLTEVEREAWTLAGNLPSQWNGREIYEGDILRYDPRSSFGGRKDDLHVVEWCRVAGIKVVDVVGLTIPIIENVEIIGNIYENSELLDGR